MCRSQNRTITTKLVVAPSIASKEVYAVIGNIIHAVHLINIVIFTECVVTHSNKSDDSLPSTINFFDPVWEKDGFCVSSPTKCVDIIILVGRSRALP
jgi:hypothetical protein